MDFETRSAAYLYYVSTGSEESRYLQPGMGQISYGLPPLRTPALDDAADNLFLAAILLPQF